MKVPVLVRKLQAATSSKHHQTSSLKWQRRGETMTGAAYEVTEWEVKTHQLLQAQSAAERYSR